MSDIFPARQQALFADAYPERSISFEHLLGAHPLMTLEALADMAVRLDPAKVEYNRGDLPIGIVAEDIPANNLAIAETIRTIDQNGSWMVLKNIEQLPEYKEMLLALLDELRPAIESTTGKMLTPQGYIFISSPNAVTPFHFDPEHNILLHVKGRKTIHVWPAGDPRFADDEAHETYHSGGHRNLAWHDDYGQHAAVTRLEPGTAVYVPVMAPHWVKVGPDPAISLSITWRSEWSYREADARMANKMLRRLGLSPSPPPRWPGDARIKALAWRVARRMGLGAH